jgi:hypothetical protein
MAVAKYHVGDRVEDAETGETGTRCAQKASCWCPTGAREMEIEKRQARLQENGDAIERWNRKLFRAANELQKLHAQRKRILYPTGKPSSYKIKFSLDEIRERAAASGYEFNDEIPS